MDRMVVYPRRIGAETARMIIPIMHKYKVMGYSVREIAHIMMQEVSCIELENVLGTIAEECPRHPRRRPALDDGIPSTERK